MSLRAAVLGHPIGHSKSPALHLPPTRGSERTSATAAIDVTEESLPAFMDSVRAETGWRGLSVTMPLKIGHGLRGGRGPRVARRPGRHQHGGVRARVGELPPGASATTPMSRGSSTPSATPVWLTRPTGVILGGGGTAAAAVAALQELGAVSRGPVRSDAPPGLKKPRPRPPTRHGHHRPALRRCCRSAVAGAGVVISTLPPRAADGMAAELEALGRRTDGVLLDVAYDPWPSRSAAAWHATAERWSPASRCCSTRRWSRSGISPAWQRPAVPPS
jgi:shikimate dehydrogenase